MKTLAETRAAMRELLERDPEWRALLGDAGPALVDDVIDKMIAICFSVLDHITSTYDDDDDTEQLLNMQAVVVELMQAHGVHTLDELLPDV